MSEPAANGSGGGYFKWSEWPLHGLIFVLPMMAAYEIGTRWLAARSPLEPPGQIVAFALMQRFFLWFGANGVMLPALAVIGILLTRHIIRKDPWRLRPAVYVGMAVESVILVAPLIALGMALPQHMPLWNIDEGTVRWIILGFGAGVYEELVFRLIGLTLIYIVLADVFRIPQKPATIVAVVISAISFSMYHYWGHEAFQWRSMVFRTLAGVYFAVLFIFRGFGITVGVHAGYDISIILLRQISADT